MSRFRIAPTDYAIAVMLVSWLTGCQKKPFGAATLENEVFRNDSSYHLLAFDLRNDSEPKVGVVFRSGPASERRTLALPFPSRAVSQNGHLLVTWGSYSHATLLDYVPPHNGDPEAVSVDAIFDHSDPDRPLDLNTLTGTLYLDRPNSNARTFLFRFPTYDLQREHPALRNILSHATDSLDYVAVVLPTDAREVGVRGGMTSWPPERFRVSNTRYFLSQNDSIRWLWINYEVPATSTQKLVLTYAVELLIAGTVPLVGLVFLDAEDLKDPTIRRKRMKVLLIGGVVEFALLITLAVYAFVIRGESGTTLLINIAILLLGLVFAGAVAWAKQKH